MVIINNSPKNQNFSHRFHEGIAGRTNGFEIISEKQINLAKNLIFHPKQSILNYIRT